MKPCRCLPAAVLLMVSTTRVSFATNIPVFIFAGQSTAICSGTDTGLIPSSALAPQLNVLLYNARTHYPATGAVHWATYQAPTGPGFATDCGHANPQGSFGPEFTTANRISTRLYGGRPVGVFKYCVGATSLYNDWNPNNPYLYPDMMLWLSNAITALPLETGYTGLVAGIFWTQGSSDGLGGTATAAAYGTNLLNFVLTLRNHFGQPRLPFVYGRTLSQWSNSQGVRDGQQALTNRLRDVFMVNADDLYMPTLHYDNNGTMTLGNRYADGLAAVLSSRMCLSVGLSGAVRLRVYGLPASLYEVEYADGPRSTDWHQLITGQTDVLGIFDCQDALPSAQARYYRFTSR